MMTSDKLLAVYSSFGKRIVDGLPVVDKAVDKAVDS